MSAFVQKYGAALYFALCMFVFLFCSYKGNIENEFIDFPHIELNFLPIYLILAISFLFMVALVLLKAPIIDFFVVLLFSRLLLHCIPIYYNGVGSHFAINFLISVLCIIVFMISFHLNAEKNFLIKIFCYFFFVLCAQIFFESYFGEISFFDDVYYYKNDLVLPIGASNALASKVIPFFSFIFILEKSMVKRLLFFAVAFFVVSLTKSRSGILDIILIMLLMLSWKGSFSISGFFKFLVVMALIGCVSVYFLYYTQIGNFIFSDSDSTVFQRAKLIQSGIDLFWNHPLFGNGLYYNDLAKNPHNWVLDVVMRSGLFGLGIAIIIVSSIVFEVKKYMRDDVIRGCFVAVLCMLWQGLSEIILFSVVHDFIMWFFIGTMLSRANHLKGKILDD
ncbi:MAG: O-antigen ligase family protein [Fibrobacter sp.]|nr:O-antigen ligase family protein [Fibrobacter sp.]